MSEVRSTSDYQPSNSPESNDCHQSSDCHQSNDPRSNTNETNTFALNIPHSRELAQQHLHYETENRQKTLETQRELVESGFKDLGNGQTTVEFDTTEPLLPEITKELRRNGYNYYYQYNYNSEEPEQNGCHVVISTKPSRLPIDSLHHNERLYHLTQEVNRNLQGLQEMFGTFTPWSWGRGFRLH